MANSNYLTENAKFINFFKTKPGITIAVVSSVTCLVLFIPALTWYIAQKEIGWVIFFSVMLVVCVKNLITAAINISKLTKATN